MQNCAYIFMVLEDSDGILRQANGGAKDQYDQRQQRDALHKSILSLRNRTIQQVPAHAKHRALVAYRDRVAASSARKAAVLSLGRSYRPFGFNLHLIKQSAARESTFMTRLITFSVLLASFVTVSALAQDQTSKGLALTPPMGWNTWNKFGCNVSEELVKGAADA